MGGQRTGGVNNFYKSIQESFLLKFIEIENGIKAESLHRERSIVFQNSFNPTNSMSIRVFDVQFAFEIRSIDLHVLP